MINLNSLLTAARNWVGILITLASGVAIIAGQLATVPAPLGITQSEWAYVGVIAAGAQLVVVALTKFSQIWGQSQIEKARIECESRERIAGIAPAPK